MHFVTIHGRRYAQFERLRREPGLIHAFCTRPADVSPHPDRQTERARRRGEMAEDLGLDPGRLSYCVQVHHSAIAVIDRTGLGVPLEDSDAVVTSIADMPVMTFSADCPLVLLYDPVRGAIGLVHASWRCTVAELTRRVVDLMRFRLGCAPADLHAGIGPGAGPCCYEVNTDVYEAARALPERDRLFARRGGRLYFDLWEANRVLLVRAGVREENIEMAGLCTMCRNDLFFSYRREGPGCGHFGLMAARRNAPFNPEPCA